MYNKFVIQTVRGFELGFGIYVTFIPSYGGSHGDQCNGQENSNQELSFCPTISPLLNLVRPFSRSLLGSG